MGFKLKYCIYILLVAFLYSCASKECIGKPRKPKKYRVSKMKSYQRGVGGGTATTVGAKEELEAKKQAEEEEKLGKPEEDIISIADSKVGAPPEEEETIEFKGQEIDLTEEDFSYEEKILFVNSTDLFSDPQEAKSQLKELTKLLKRNKNIFVTIQGNTATTRPAEGTIYGDSEEALSAEIIFNVKKSTIRESMLARAKRVYDLLVENGVDPKQLEYVTGSHRQYKRERVVSFILKKSQ